MIAGRTVLARLDDVLEYLCFDVMLATPVRRCAVLGAAGLAALTTHLFWGVVFAPPPGPYPRSRNGGMLPGQCPPYPGSWSMEDGKLARRLIEGQVLTAAEERSLLQALDARRADLDAVVALEEPGAPVAFTRFPEFVQLRILGEMLIARGILRRREDPEGAGVLDILTAARVGRQVAKGYQGSPPIVIEGLVGGVLVKLAYRTLSKDPSAAIAPTILEDLARHSRSWPARTEFLRGELEWFRELTNHWAETNEWPMESWHVIPLRMALPMKREARRKAAGALIEQVAAHLEEQKAVLEKPGTEVREDWNEVSVMDILTRNSLVDLALAPYSTERGARVVARSWTRGLSFENSVVPVRLAEVDESVRALEEACRRVM